MKLFLVIMASAHIVGVAGPLKSCPAFSRFHGYDVACAHFAKRPTFGAYLI